jgi:DedD protein
MIRLPSFFKRKTQSDDLETGSVGRRTTKRAAPRAFQRAVESEELALTEDPEQQRARHRLIGATVLVLVAVIGLPRILDNKPKAVNNDIAVNIVTSLPTPVAEPKAEVKAEEKPKAVPSSPEVKTEAKTEVKAEVKTEPKSATATPSKTPALGLAAGEEVVAADPNAKSKVDTAAKAVDSPAQKSSVKYVVLVGSFATEESVKNVTSKLKEMKIPYTVTSKTRNDGIKFSIFRTTPYADKDAAEAAEKKIKANLNPSAKIIEVGKQ